MLLAARWHALVPQAAQEGDLETCLEAVIASSRAAYPDFVVPDDEFVAYLAARVAPTADAIAAVVVADLYFACAVARGDGAALRAFEAIQLAGIDAAIAHLDGGSALVADVKTAVRDRVLVHGGKGKITEYHGRGSLQGWLRVVAVREALQLLRARRREAPMPSGGLTDLATEIAVEPPALTATEQRSYREGFTSALATLTPRERNLLRQHYLHRATVAEIGALYGVHGATAARWIAQIRETLLRRTRRHVGEALRLTGTELDSAMAKAADHLDYSLRHTLSHET